MRSDLTFLSYIVQGYSFFVDTVQISEAKLQKGIRYDVEISVTNTACNDTCDAEIAKK